LEGKTTEPSCSLSAIAEFLVQHISLTGVCSYLYHILMISVLDLLYSSRHPLYICWLLEGFGRGERSNFRFASGCAL